MVLLCSLFLPVGATAQQLAGPGGGEGQGVETEEVNSPELGVGAGMPMSQVSKLDKYLRYLFIFIYLMIKWSQDSIWADNF
jgi:hypothetical protein